jgi:hypothetical protein
MAAAYISEYVTVGVPGPDGVSFQAPVEPAIAEQLVAISGSSTQSAAFNSQTRMIRVNVDSVASLAFGLNPTATTSIKRLSAGQTEYFCVNGGSKVAVISNV